MQLVGFKAGLPPLEMELRDAWLEAVIAALRKLHAAGYQHLDVHPANVMWREVRNEGVATQAAATNVSVTGVGAGAAAAAGGAGAAILAGKAAGAHWARLAAEVACKDSQGRVEVVLLDIDSASKSDLPLPEKRPDGSGGIEPLGISLPKGAASLPATAGVCGLVPIDGHGHAAALGLGRPR